MIPTDVAFASAPTALKSPGAWQVLAPSSGIRPLERARTFLHGAICGS